VGGTLPLEILTSFFPTLRLWPTGATALFIAAMNRVRDFFEAEENLSYHKELRRAIEKAMDDMREANPGGWEFAVTGHSLGGGLSGIMGANFNIMSVAFSPPGLALTHKKFDMKRRSMAQYSVALLPMRDPVVLVDAHFGLVQHTICRRGLPMLCHIPGEMICDLIARCESRDSKRFRSCATDTTDDKLNLTALSRMLRLG